MSKLTMTVAGLVLLIFCGTSLLSANPSLDSDENQTWGKTQGAVNVRIKEIAKTDTIVELEGQIRSKQNSLDIEWKLPDGAFLVEGDLQKSVERSANGGYGSLKVKIDISNAKNEPIAFHASFGPEDSRTGHARVYKWNKTKKESEHLEKIRARMKKRKVEYVP